MIPILFGLAARVIETKRESFNSALEKSDYNLVLVTSVNVHDSKKILKYFTAAAHKSENGVGFISLDVSNDNKNIQYYSIVDAPLIFLYYKSDRIVQYTDNYTVEDIYKYSLRVLEEPVVHYPKNAFEILEFQQLAPANLIITDTSLVPQINQYARICHCLVHFAVVEDSKLVSDLNLDDIVFTKPYEEFTTNFDSLISVRDLIKYSQTTWNFVANQNLIGKQSVCVLYDKSIPWHFHRINEVFNQSKVELGIPQIRYFAIDFFDAPKFVRQFGVFKFSYPLFFVTGPTLSIWQVCDNPLQPAEDIYYWIRFQLTGKGKPEVISRVPMLYANDFMKIALDAGSDCILLVADPGMEHYKECKKNAEIIAEVFAGCDNIRIYEFNPRTEHVLGLQIPQKNTPQFSVWPAVDPYNGKTFQADYPLNEIFKILLKIFKAPIKDEQAKAAVALARQLIPGL